MRQLGQVGVIAGLALSGVVLAGCGGGDDGPEPGTIHVTIDGLEDGHTVSLRAFHHDVFTGDSVEIWFEDVGNGSHAEEAPPRTYDLTCNPPSEPDGEYRPEEPVEQQATLAPGGSIDFHCSYVRFASLRLIFEGFDDTIPDDWPVATFTKEPEGTERSVGRGQSGEPIRLEPGTYDVACNEVVGNTSTTRFRLADTSADTVTLAPGEVGEVTCRWEEEA